MCKDTEGLFLDEAFNFLDIAKLTASTKGNSLVEVAKSQEDTRAVRTRQLAGPEHT